MTDYSVPTLTSPSLPVNGIATGQARDPVARGLPAGAMRFLFDLDFSWCYPGGPMQGRPAPSSPADEQVIYDIGERENGKYERQGATPSANYAGGGFDFAPVSRTPFGVKAPATAWASIHSAANRYFLWCGYYRLPSSGDWKASNGNFPIFESSEANGTYITQVDPLVIFQITPTVGNPRLIARRQVLVGASTANASVLELTPTADYFGQLCQISYWRNAAGQGFRMKSGLAETSAAAAVGTETALNFSATRPTWGRSPTPDNGNMNTEDQAASNYRVYRGWLEDLSLSGRDPLTVLNADWARVIARKTASGGTIFS